MLPKYAVDTNRRAEKWDIQVRDELSRMLFIIGSSIMPKPALIVTCHWRKYAE